MTTAAAGTRARTPYADAVTPSAALTEEPASEAGTVRLGGMALRNGLLVHGPDHWAVGLRTSDGQVKVESGHKPRVRGAISEIPGLRGLARLAEAFALLPVVKREMHKYLEDRKSGTLKELGEEATSTTTSS